MGTLVDKYVSPRMHEVLKRDLSKWDQSARDFLVEEFLKYLFIASYSNGMFLQCSLEIDEVWQVFVLETREYRELCNKINPGRFVDHKGIEFTDDIQEKSKESILEESLSVLVNYRKNFGDFTSDTLRHWAFAEHIAKEYKLSVQGLNCFLNDLLLKNAVEVVRPSNSDYLKKLHAEAPEKKYAFFEQMTCRSDINSYEACVQAMNLKGNESVFDFGCGDGILSRYLPDSSISRYVGIDISSASLSRARNRFHSDKKEFLLYSGESFPLEDRTFDVACAHMVLALVGDVEGSLKEISRILKHGGKFVAFTPAYWRKGLSEKSQRFEYLLRCFSKFIPNKSSIIAKSHPFLTKGGIEDALKNQTEFSNFSTFESDFVVELRPLDALSIFTEGFYEFDIIDDSAKPEAAAFFLKELIHLADDDGIVRFDRPMELIFAEKLIKS